MKRRQALTSFALSGLASPLMLAVAADPAGGSEKKGWCGGSADLHRKFKAKWYYTWSPKTQPSKECEFVPMMKGAWSLGQIPAVQKMGGISSLLGFNEPSRQKQGNITVEDALKAWPKLEALAKKKNLRLGSPAPTSDGPGMAWHAKFMKEAEERKLRIDFVAMHWYRSRNADEFEKFVEGLVKKFRKPIWITEFNGWTGPEDENYEFLKDSLKFLDRNSDVERYAYFNPKKGSPHSLLKADGSLSRMGELYRDA